MNETQKPKRSYAGEFGCLGIAVLVALIVLASPAGNYFVGAWIADATNFVGANVTSILVTVVIGVAIFGIAIPLAVANLKKNYVQKAKND